MGSIYFETGHTDKLVDTDFNHVEHTTVEHTNKGETIWSFFGGLPNEEEGCVVFCGPEFEG